MNIGERLKSARLKNGKSQKELGDLLQLSQNTISQIENNKSSITIESLILICNEYNISADWILFGKDSEDKIINKYRSLNPEEKVIVDMILNKASERDGFEKIGNL